jgi:hypothetical protein
MLFELRKRIEASGEACEGVEWWQWFERRSVLSRESAEQAMRHATRRDSEGELEARLPRVGTPRKQQKRWCD